MRNFDYMINTKVIFGENRISELGGEILKYTDRILLIYGKGSIKKIGLYDKIITNLKENKIEFKELSGILPNPRLKDVKRGIDLVKQHNLGLVLAVGGGSTIDSAKAIAFGAMVDENVDIWDYFQRKRIVEKALPIASILTLSATGSEMNGGTVISKLDTEEKLSTNSDLLRPKFSFLDPSLTYSVPGYQTASGTVDIFMHVMEQYFSKEAGTFIQDRLCEAILKVCIEYGRKAIDNPRSYEARANLMWASSIALNRLLTYGRIGDWATHLIEHEVSAIYDITHGVGLSILLPAWLKFNLQDEDSLFKFKEYARNVWDIREENAFKAGEASIEKTIAFFKSLDMPVKFSEIDIDDSRFEEIAQKATRFGEIGVFRKLAQDDVFEILKLAE